MQNPNFLLHSFRDHTDHGSTVDTDIDPDQEYYCGQKVTLTFVEITFIPLKKSLKYTEKTRFFKKVILK